MNMRPTSMTSNGSIMTWPPAALIFAAVTSALSVARYVVQNVPMSGSDFPPMPATGRPPIEHMRYPPPSGPVSKTSQPNRPR